ncbi:MAG TPA: TMEM175 family protein [Pseudonocardiaceae bacterium]|nr:TMEM175 family protein [Pseudonocardiaceae bacterium]
MSTPAGPESNDEVREVEVRAVAAERLTFFTDAVVAIALTLLALDLPLPSGNTNAEILHSAGEHREEYLAFMLSFVVISAHWRNHHRTFRYLTSVTSRLTSLTMAWLFMQVAMPFATRVLTGGGAFQARFGFYALVQAAADMIFLLMIWEIRRNQLHRRDIPQGVLRRTGMHSATLGLAFVISIPVSFFTGWSYAVWGAAPVLNMIAIRVRKRIHPGQPEYQHM